LFPQIFGKYVLERELASGGMAIVYLATLRGAGGFEKRLVVKQIRAELASDAAFVDRFVAEAKTTVELSHPNIVPVYELGVEQGVYFIAMELALGVTLAELLRESGRLSPEEGAYLGVEICRALDYAHRKMGIVHRDATPRNVLIDEEGAVRLIDFGIAAPVSTDGSARERVFGSPGHMPKEQLRGGRLTPATDVFAAGALLYESWTSVAPFRRATRAESDAALEATPPKLSDVDARLAPLDDVVLRAVAVEAADRPQTADDLARPLREFLRSADLGDIARRLGERVQAARDRGKAPRTEPITADESKTGVRPSVPPTPVTPATRASKDFVTETFATREIVDRRTSRPPPPDDATPATSGTPETATPASSRGAAVRSDAHADERSNSVVVPANASAGTRDAPDGAGGKSPQHAPRRIAVWLSLLAAVATTGVVISAIHGRRSARSATPVATAGATRGAEPRTDPRPAELAPTTVAPVAPVTPRAGLAGSSVAPVASPSAAPIALPRLGLAVPSASARPVGSAEANASPETAESAEASPRSQAAVFSLTSDLPARVVVDGAAAGTTPIRSLRRPAGAHVIVFSSVELGERLTANVVAKPGQTVGVHAEFTRPTPMLRIR
jgi:serine/threonine-protein kinase